MLCNAQFGVPENYLVKTQTEGIIVQDYSKRYFSQYYDFRFYLIVFFILQCNKLVNIGQYVLLTLIALHVPFLHYIKPVSYTHLDVYKRQRYR